MPQEQYTVKTRLNHQQHEFLIEQGREIGIKPKATILVSLLNKLKRIAEDPDVVNYMKIHGLTLTGLIEIAVKEFVQPTKRFIR